MMLGWHYQAITQVTRNGIRQQALLCRRYLRQSIRGPLIERFHHPHKSEWKPTSAAFEGTSRVHKDNLTICKSQKTNKIGLGWVEGFEPSTAGATVRSSTTELHPPQLSKNYSIRRERRFSRCRRCLRFAERLVYPFRLSFLSMGDRALCSLFAVFCWASR